MNNIKKTLRLIILTTIIVQVIQYIFNGFHVEYLLSVKVWGVTLMYSCVLTFLNIWFFDILNARLSWEKDGLKKMLVGISGTIIVTLAGLLLCRIIDETIISNHLDLFTFFEKERAHNYLFGLLFTTVISLFYHALGFYKALQEKKVEEQKIIAGTASAKYDALKSQLDPHFLFNSLNVLTSLISENPKMAEKFTTSLSKIYRYVLEQKNKNLVSVDEELKFAKTYISLLQMRFENSITLELPKEASDPHAKIVPLSLQIVLENTVKHNIVMQDQPLHIKIYEADGCLVVENNLQPKEVLGTSSGFGLTNIKERYRQLTKREFSVYKSATSFIAKLPILTKKVIVVTEEELKTMKLDTNAERYKKAQEHIKEIKSFYMHLSAYCIIIPALAIFNLITSPGYLWFLFSMTGWGAGVALHAANVFGPKIFLGKDWEKRKIKEYMEEH